VNPSDVIESELAGEGEATAPSSLHELRAEGPLSTAAPRAAGSAIRAVVGDADPLYVAGITASLQQAGVEVVASAHNLDDLLRKTRAYHPDVAVADIGIPPSLTDEDRIDAVSRLRAIDPRMSVLILSDAPDARYAEAVLGERPEGLGLLVKASIRDVEDFAASVHLVARGGTALDPRVVSRLAGRRPQKDPLDELTNRERQVLALMAQGRSNGSIAGELVVTIAAVERHITSIFSKLDLCRDGADHRRVLAVLVYLGIAPG
jgi:DNA-binding NarL/FixJ family response regulator